MANSSTTGLAVRASHVDELGGGRDAPAAIERVSSGSLPQSFQVCQILQPARSPLILNQGLAPQEGHCEFINRHDPSRLPCIAKIDPGQVSEEVDPSRRKSDLDDSIRPIQVVNRNAERLERRSELNDSGPDTPRVVHVPFDPYIEIPGGPGNPVRRQCMGASDQKPSASVEQGTENVAEVLVQLAGPLSPARPLSTRIGVADRPY